MLIMNIIIKIMIVATIFFISPLLCVVAEVLHNINNMHIIPWITRLSESHGMKVKMNETNQRQLYQRCFGILQVGKVHGLCCLG